MPQGHGARLPFIFKLYRNVLIYPIVCFGSDDVIILSWALGLLDELINDTQVNNYLLNGNKVPLYFTEANWRFFERREKSNSSRVHRGEIKALFSV